MALPSSPPLLPEVVVPSWPALPSIDISNTFPKTLKRQISDYASQQSSDPVFSDTPSDAEQQLDEQGQPKRKKIVKGPWWNVRRGSERGLRRSQRCRTKIRNFDSGVWMGSDSSEESNSSMLSDQQRLQMSDGLRSDDCDTIPDSEAIAADFIQRCLDQGKEAVDLTDLGLYSISNITLRPLHQLIRHSHDDLTQAPSEDEFVPLTPSLQLFLAKNSLATLPTELFTFNNLAVLSLRSNKLIRLPSAIARLQNLEELNVSGNRLKFLPWEMLDLFSCRQTHREITIRPNPLVDPVNLAKSSARNPHKGEGTAMPGVHILGTDDALTTQDSYQVEDASGMREDMNARLQHIRSLHPGGISKTCILRFCVDELIYLASSQIRYFRPDGTPTQHNVASLGTQSEYPAVHDPMRDEPRLSFVSSVPSLYELALRSLQANFDLQGVTKTLQADNNIPGPVIESLEKAATNTTEFGNEHCSTCGRQMIITRAAWMEYWFRGVPLEEPLTKDDILPFLRKACSWACAKPTELGTFR